jgi:hypothetical protein
VACPHAISIPCFPFIPWAHQAVELNEYGLGAFFPGRVCSYPHSPSRVLAIFSPPFHLCLSRCPLIQVHRPLPRMHRLLFRVRRLQYSTSGQ